MLLPLFQGRRKHFLVGQARYLEDNGAQSAPRNFYHFNYIHVHDVINIVPLWCTHLPIARLAQASACIRQCTGTHMREIIQRGYAPHFQLWAGSMNKLSCQKVVRPKSDQPDRQRRPCFLRVTLKTWEWPGDEAT